MPTLTHLGIIADGNRRWAASQGKPSIEGHRAGINTLEKIIDYLPSTEIKYATFYLFSNENWNRSADELKYFMELAGSAISKVVKKAVKNNVRIAILGRPDKVDPKLWAKLLEAEKLTSKNTGLTACVCFNYGGQWEIADAATKAFAAGATTLTPEILSLNLYHPEIPPVDLIVRTSGEQRTSGFMLWRAAYSELYFLEKYFPDLSNEDIDSIITEYHKRQRRFGS